MKTTITFIGTNPATSHLHDKTFAAEINYLGSGVGDEASMYLIETADRKLLMDVKEVKSLDGLTLFGILQDEDKVGRVAIKLQ